MLSKGLLLLILICTSLQVGQSQILGLRSPGVKWNQVDTDTVRVIFPEGLEHRATRIANVVHYMSANHPLPTDTKIRKISIVLQNQTSTSNGYVGFGPYRSEFYLQPFQDGFQLGALPWDDLLAIHEWRHVQQLSATNVGISNLVLNLIGQNAYSGMIHLSVPDWYLEGDAVIAETVLTKQGRGRLSSFTKGYREKLSNGKPWPYALVRNGSYKRWLPNEYPLGYLMITHGREKWGQDFWNETLEDAAKYKGLFYPFSRAIKKSKGLNTTELYEETMQKYKKIWADVESESPGYEQINITTGNWSDGDKYRDYHSPAVDGLGNIYTMIDRFDKADAIYRISPTGELKLLTSIGFQNDPHFGLGGDLLAWSEIRIHPRWSAEDKSVIVSYDLQKRKKTQVTAEGSYYMPSPDASGKKIIALQTDEFGEHKLVIIDASTGAHLKELPNPKNYYLGYPSWSPDQKNIIASARDETGRMTVVYQNIESGKITPLIHWSHHVYGRSVQLDNWIFISCNVNFTDHIFGFNPTEGILYEVTRGSKFHYEPTIDPVQNQIVFREFGLNGSRLRRTPFDPGNWRTVNMGSGVKQVYLEEGDTDILNNVPSTLREVSKYPMLTNPVLIHSWNLEADDPQFKVELLSENVLGNVGITAGYRYNRNNKSFGPYINATLGFWYPELTFGYNAVARNLVTTDGRETKLSQNTWFAGYRLPFQFTSGPYNQFFSLSSNVNVGFAKFKPDFGSLPKSRLSYLSHGVVLSNRKRLAYQHEIPRFGQSLRLNYAHSIDSLSINQFTALSDFSFPGFSNNHAFIFQFDYVREPSENDISLGDSFQYSRGYGAQENDQAFRIGVNYHLPLLYPDMGFGGLFFIKRLRIKPFFDHTRLFLDEGNRTLQSVGSEFLFDINVFNVESVTFGVRWSHLLNDDLLPQVNKNVFEFFIPLERL